MAGLMMLIGPCLHLVLGRRAPVRLWAAALVGGGGTLAAVACSAAGLDDTDLRMLLFGDLTFTGRTDTWTHIVPEIARRPWLGHGFGSFWDTGQLYNPIESAAQSDWFMNAQLINTAHDGCLDVLLQTGLVGFAIAVTAILRCVVLLTAGATAGGPVERVALTGALCVAICVILNNFLESYLFRTGDNLGYLFTFLMLHGEAARLRRQGSPGVAVTVAP